MFAISASISLLKPARPTAPTTTPLTWIGTPPRSTKMPAGTKAVRARFMLSSISALAAPPFVPSMAMATLIYQPSYAIMRRATGADGGDGDDYAARHEQCGPGQPPTANIQRRYQNGIRSEKQGIWPRTAS